MTSRTALPCTLTTVGLALALTACSGASTTTARSTTTATGSPMSTTASNTTAAGALVVQDPWIKAVKGGMTGVFATLKNNTDTDVTVVRAESPASDMVQLHVTEKDSTGAMVMKESTKGFTVPAHGTVELRPGGNHIMLMGLKGPVLSGTDTEVTLVTQDGVRVPIHAPAREFNGAKETYGGMSMTPNQSAPAATPSHSGH